jgi:rhamnosyltransferase
MRDVNLPVPRVAVLLAAYNGMQYIAEQMDSILAQIGVDVTVFISVDRSTDGTEKWVEALAQANTPRCTSTLWRALWWCSA